MRGVRSACIGAASSLSSLYGKGAQNAHLAEGAASKRISELEATLGVTPTLAGCAVQEHAGRILSDVDHLASDLADRAAGLVGVVRPWVNTSAVTQFFATRPRHLRCDPFRRSHRVEGALQPRSLAGGAGRAHRVGHLRGPHTAEGLARQGLSSDHLVLVVSRGHALAARRAIEFAAATDMGFVTLGAGTLIAERLEPESVAIGKRLRLRIQVRSFDAMCQMAAAGLGTVVLPEAACRAHLRSMKLPNIGIRDTWARRTCCWACVTRLLCPGPHGYWPSIWSRTVESRGRPLSAACDEQIIDFL